MVRLNVLNAKADTARHVADVFLQVAYGDSTKEQIVVPYGRGKRMTGK